MLCLSQLNGFGLSLARQAFNGRSEKYELDAPCYATNDIII